MNKIQTILAMWSVILRLIGSGEIHEIATWVLAVLSIVEITVSSIRYVIAGHSLSLCNKFCAAGAVLLGFGATLGNTFLVSSGLNTLSIVHCLKAGRECVRKSRSLRKRLILRIRR